MRGSTLGVGEDFESEMGRRHTAFLGEGVFVVAGDFSGDIFFFFEGRADFKGVRSGASGDKLVIPAAVNSFHPYRRDDPPDGAV